MCRVHRCHTIQVQHSLTSRVPFRAVSTAAVRNCLFWLLPRLWWNTKPVASPLTLSLPTDLLRLLRVMESLLNTKLCLKNIKTRRKKQPKHINTTWLILSYTDANIQRNKPGTFKQFANTKQAWKESQHTTVWTVQIKDESNFWTELQKDQTEKNTSRAYGLNWTASL